MGSETAPDLIMDVEFKKYCPWSYRITRGTFVKHLEGSKATVPTAEGLEMIRADYADEVQSAVRPPIRKIIAPDETKIVKPEEVKSLEDMTKLELETEGRKDGIELDRRRSKPKLVKRVRANKKKGKK